MRVDLDAKVRTKDGHDAGRVSRVVWDPRRNEVSEFVVGTGGLLGHDVLVGRDVLESASRDGEAIVVDMTKDELARSKPYDEAQFTAPPEGWMVPVGWGYGMPGYVWPVAMVPSAAEPAGPQEPPLPSITKGMPVKDQNGHVIGDVQDIVMDDSSGRLRSIVVRRANALERLTGGGDTMQIGAEQLDIADGAVHLVEVQRAPQ